VDVSVHGVEISGDDRFWGGSLGELNRWVKLAGAMGGRKGVLHPHLALDFNPAGGLGRGIKSKGKILMKSILRKRNAGGLG
jgi:hypothetical protein